MNVLVFNRKISIISPLSPKGCDVESQIIHNRRAEKKYRCVDIGAVFRDVGRERKKSDQHKFCEQFIESKSYGIESMRLCTVNMC